MNINKSDIREVYSIDSKDGTLLIVKRNIDKYISSRHRYEYNPDLLINPVIKILDNGVLLISGLRLSYVSVRKINNHSWEPLPVTDLDNGWEETIFYNDSDIIKKDVREWVRGICWPLMKRITHKNIDHLNEGYYLKTSGYIDTQSTSNYRIIGFDKLELSGLIC